MLSEALKQEYYQAMKDKNSAYEGVFYVGVKSTGIFCRPVCPARKPMYQNCDFYLTAQEALLASYRPCLRCKPLSYPGILSPVAQKLVDAVEANPEKRWKESDFRDLGIDSSTLRRQFKKRFGMTFVQYARARRMGMAMKDLQKGISVLDTQLNTGYESSSGFRDAFTKIMGAPPSLPHKQLKELKAKWIDTPLGPMVAMADETHLYLLEFIDRRGLEREVERLRKRLQVAILPGVTAAISSIENELALYFSGKLKAFKTPVYMMGSDFQKMAWKSLIEIPYGHTRSYAQQAAHIGKERAFRAAARANATNQLAIIIPCHRIINSSGDLGGYAGGIVRKQWLLDLEKKYAD